MQIDEVIRNSANTAPLEWLAKALAATSLIHWGVTKWRYRNDPAAWKHANEMETATYAACCQLDIWDYRGRFRRAAT